MVVLILVASIFVSVWLDFKTRNLIVELTLKSSKECNYTLYLAIKTLYTLLFSGVFFLDTKSIMIRTHSCSHTGLNVHSICKQSPEHTAAGTPVALCSSIPFIATAHITVLVHITLTSEQTHFYSDKCAIPAYASHFHSRPCMCITDNLILQQNGIL